MTKTTPQDQFLHTLAVYRARLESEQAAFAMLPETDIIARRDEFLLAADGLLIGYRPSRITLAAPDR